MMTFHIQGPMDMVILGSDKGFPVKVPPMLRLTSSINIGFLIPSLKEEMVVEIVLWFSHAKSMAKVIYKNS